MRFTEALRQGSPWHLLLGVAFVAFGIAITMAGVWITFDFWAWSWYNPWQTTPNWLFCYPVFLRCVTPANASEILDVGMVGATILGWFLGVFGVYIIVTVYENMQ